MNSRALRRSLLLGAASVAAFSLSGPAFAQDSGKVETVIVTGSRIPTTNLTTTSPVTELSAEDIHTQGVSRVEDLVTQLPQAFAAQNSTVSNGASGTATVDLRGLGSSRTLVLVDGLRLPYGSPEDTAADLNEIPTQMVERIEVLTGGASAVYGSDAIAGVVNFIMKKDFEGFQIDAQYNTFQHDNAYSGAGNMRAVIAARAATNPSQFKLPANNVMDGAGVSLSAIMGVSSANGKGNVTAYFEYRNNQPVLEANRDYSACTIGSAVGANFTCGGSSTSYPGRFTDFSTYNSTLGATPGTFVPFSPTLNQYNYGPLNYFQRPDTRYAMGAFGHYHVNSHVEIYTQLMFTDYHSVAQIAPSGDFGNTSQLNCGNPLISAQQLTTIGCSPADVAANTIKKGQYILRRNVEGGPRQDDLGYQSYRSVVGVRGDLTKGWTYDVSGQWSKVVLSRHYNNEFSVVRLNRALNVVSGPGGVPTCQSVVDGTDPNCVPYDVFTGAGPSKAALKYLSVPLLATGSTTLQDIIASVNGDLGENGVISPWAKSGVAIAVGLEYRNNYLNTLPDLEFQTGDGAGQGGPTLPVGGSTAVSEGFMELNIPVAENQPFAKVVSIDAAYRYSSYNGGATTNTWKVGGDWAPVDDFRLRANYSHAARAANVIELFTPQGISLFDLTAGDPCGALSIGTAAHATLAQCVATGVPAAKYNSSALDSPAGQYNQNGGGNPGLAPEAANTWTVGGVFTPTFIPGLTGSVDYYNITVVNLISTVGAVNVLNGCYTGGLATLCALIHRNPLGLLWVNGGFVANNNTNIGFEKTSGIDINAAYQMDLGDVGLEGDGSLTFTFVGTKELTYAFNTGVPGQATYDCTGLYAGQCGTPNPAWRHRFRTTWQMPWDDIALSGTWRYYSEVTNTTLTPAAIDYALPAQSYFDLEASIPLKNNTTLRLGVNNVLDSDPPLSRSAGTGGNGNTYPQLYDSMGRYLFAGININL